MLEVEEAPPGAPSEAPTAARPTDPARRRFAQACLIGLALASIPFTWTLFNGKAELRADPQAGISEFYDIQARAFLRGDLAVPSGSLGIEEFVVDGQSHMYFGPLPAILRMPVLAVTHRFDGQLTAPSMLLGWIVAGTFASLLLWRVRTLIRGPDPVSRTEAIAVALFLTTVAGGSALVYLAARTIVYNEAILWGGALMLGALFCIAGVLERPSIGRITAAGLLTLAAVLTRSTSGFGAAGALLLVTALVLLDKNRRPDRRWWPLLLAAAIVPVLIYAGINEAKFKTAVSLPMEAQVWTQISEQRQEVLRANNGSYFRVSFLPSTLSQYVRPDALRVSRVFPFITMPAEPAPARLGAVLDQTYRTSSAPAAMPLLVLLGIGGLVAAFRPRAGRAALLRIPIIGAAAATSGVLLIGYIANRYLGDFMPVMVVAGAVGLVELCRRLETKTRAWRVGAVSVMAVLAGFGVVTNVALAYTEARVQFHGTRAAIDYVTLQKQMSDRMGDPLASRVIRADDVPPTGGPEALLIVGDCEGLYLSSGEQHGSPWIPLERSLTGGRHDMTITFTSALSPGTRYPLVTVGGPEARSVVYVEGVGPDQVRFGVDDPHFSEVDAPIRVERGRTYSVVVTTDPRIHESSLLLDGNKVFDAMLSSAGPQQSHPGSAGPAGEAPVMTIADAPAVEPKLCRSLTTPAG